MPRRRAIIRCQEDGAALRECRVLCKNSDTRAAVSMIGAAFLSTAPPNQIQFFFNEM
jgi:hypothetical protein